MRIISGEARGRPIRVPRGRGTRPALDQTRGSIFAILRESVEDGGVLDLFAGSGAFGLEAISRGARSATFVESDREAVSLLRRNIEELGFSGRSRVIQGDALKRPAGEEAYDLIFMDPPFALLEEPSGRQALELRLEALLGRTLTPGGILILRLPLRHELHTKSVPAQRRVFGASSVLFFEKP